MTASFDSVAVPKLVPKLGVPERRQEAIRICRLFRWEEWVLSSGGKKNTKIRGEINPIRINLNRIHPVTIMSPLTQMYLFFADLVFFE